MQTAQPNGRPALTADAADRLVIGLGVLLTALALGYFAAADHQLVSTHGMVAIFRYLLFVIDGRTAWLSLGVCLLAALWTNPAPMERLAQFVGTHRHAVSAATVALLALGSLFVYHDTAFSMDEYAAVFQAKVFASGRLTAPLPPTVVDWLLPPGFNGAFLVASRMTGKAIEAYWPGFALLLAPFEWLGVPWLCNATLAGLALLLIGRITLELTGERRAAGWAALFALASGAFVANALSFYSMQAHLTANLLFVWLLFKPVPLRAFAAGAVGSLALILHNPFPHVLFAAPWLISMVWRADQRNALRCVALGYLPLLIVTVPGWLHLRAAVGSGGSGFHAMVGSHLMSVFRLPDSGMIGLRVAAAVKLWVWAVPGLFLLAALGRYRLGDDPRVRLLALSAAFTFAGYVFVIFDQGHGWGYRYFHSAWGVIPILAGCAMSRRAAPSARLLAFAGAAAVLNLLVVLPYQLLQIDRVILGHSAQLPPPVRPGNDVYFVRGDGFYTGDLVQMDPLLRDRDLILFSRGPQKDAELRRQNWPDARLVDRGNGIEEWNLGGRDVRQPLASAPAILGFQPVYAGP